MIRLALLRHGHTHWNRTGRIQGRTDIPLDEEAIRQLTAQKLPGNWVDATLWSSPLSRAFETAKIVSDRSPVADPALMEMDWGDWEGKHGAMLRPEPESGFKDIEDWGWHYTPPNGESPNALRERLIPWAEGLNGDNVAVCHIGVMRVLLAHATGWAFRGPAPFQIKRNRLYIITIADTKWNWLSEPLRLESRTA